MVCHFGENMGTRLSKASLSYWESRVSVVRPFSLAWVSIGTAYFCPAGEDREPQLIVGIFSSRFKGLDTRQPSLSSLLLGFSLVV